MNAILPVLLPMALILITWATFAYILGKHHGRREDEPFEVLHIRR